MSENRAPVTNERVAKDLGITHSAVSRIRSGDRLPSLQLVRKIYAAFNWPIEEQISTMDPGKYAVAFEEILRKRYVSSSVPLTHDTEEDQ